MKKIYFVIMLISMSSQLVGQSNNQLNEMIIESLRSYLNYSSELQKKVCSNCEKHNTYICNDGLPADFPCDSMQNVTFLSLHNWNGLSKSLQKELKKGISACFVWLKLTDRQLVISIGGRSVKLIKKNNLGISVGDWGIFTYEYSCEKQKWLLVNTEYGGI
ncbi:MAG: hypothetical protein LBT04_06265 [Prevotellaceae bacterium]|jgi:hypothetical protein|nr:hypothetical protein [Prevotellaceae bacterium]